MPNLQKLDGEFGKSTKNRWGDTILGDETEFPKEYSQLTNLIYLRLQGRFHGKLPKVWKVLTNLQHLNFLICLHFSAYVRCVLLHYLLRHTCCNLHLSF